MEVDALAQTTFEAVEIAADWTVKKVSRPALVETVVDVRRKPTERDELNAQT